VKTNEQFKLFSNVCALAPVFALAFSLGANLLVNTLSDHGIRIIALFCLLFFPVFSHCFLLASSLSFVAGAAAIASPWDLMRSNKQLEA
jgi:hypothetical protein